MSMRSSNVLERPVQRFVDAVRLGCLAGGFSDGAGEIFDEDKVTALLAVAEHGRPRRRR